MDNIPDNVKPLPDPVKKGIVSTEYISAKNKKIISRNSALKKEKEKPVIHEKAMLISRGKFTIAPTRTSRCELVYGDRFGIPSSELKDSPACVYSVKIDNPMNAIEAPLNHYISHEDKNSVVVEIENPHEDNGRISGSITMFIINAGFVRNLGEILIE